MRTGSLTGFTLIELLVVMSILTLLTSIVLATLNSARINASNNALRAQMSAIRTEAGLMYLNTGNYDSVCAQGTPSGNIFANATKDAAVNTSGAAIGLCFSSGANCEVYTTSVSYNAACQGAHAGQWAASLQEKNGYYYCVDYTGFAGEISGRGIDNSPWDPNCQ